MQTRARIDGLGLYVPERVLDNFELERQVNTSDDWIITRTGIKERRVAAPGEACSDLALHASRQAMQMADVSAKELTHILLATFTPDYCTPTTACLLQSKLAADKCQMAMDLAAGCSGFVYGLEAARGICLLNNKAKILLVGSEVCTSRLNFKDRNTCVLFGDGAGAMVISPSQENSSVVVDTLLRSDGSLGDLLPVGKTGGSKQPFELSQEVDEEYFIHMKGRELFRHAVRGMAELGWEILKKNGLTVTDIDLLIPHQANLRIIEALAKKMSIDMDSVYVNVDCYGNTSAASVIIALSEAYQKGRIKEGMRVLLVTFGAGLTWSAAILEF